MPERKIGISWVVAISFWMVALGAMLARCTQPAPTPTPQIAKVIVEHRTIK